MASQQRFLAQVLVSLLNARESESARVSRLLHDEVGQVLSAVGLHLSVLRMDLGSREPEAAEQTLAIQEMLEQAVSHVRDLSYELNPDIVERIGLHYALERLINRHKSHFAGTIRFYDEVPVRLPVLVATAFYKIAEQAVDNAARHSGARQVKVMLKPSGAAISLEIRDNGAGFSVDQAAHKAEGLGLLLMSFHAERAGLQYSLKSTPGKGTVVRVTYVPGDRGGREEQPAPESTIS